jgi:hypothetical protein
MQTGIFGRSLGLLCGALLFTLVGCRDEGPAKTAGQEIEKTVEMASQSSPDTLETLGSKVDDAVEQTHETAKENEPTSDEPGPE